MKNTNNSIDEQLRKYASSQKVYLPADYDKMVENSINQGLERNRSMKKRIPKAVAAAVAVSVVLAGTGGVYAAKNYIFDRIDSITEKQQKNYVSEVNNSDVDADSFSRELTKAEVSRFKELQKSYENKGKFPTGSVKVIKSSSDVNSGKVCFESSNSKFYLPDNLTDEDMLEIIDFYYSRDYSLAQSTANEPDMQNIDETITENEAVKLAKSTLVKVFDANVESSDTSVEHDAGTGNGEAFSTDYIKITDNNSGTVYTVTVNLQEATVDSIEKNVDSYSESEVEDKQLYDSVAQATLNAANNMMDGAGNWSSEEYEYAVNSENVLKQGVVNYYFAAENGKVCMVSYSQENKDIYRVMVMNQDECNARRDDYSKTMKSQGYEVKTVTK